jgi:GxxExxY protein
VKTGLTTEGTEYTEEYPEKNLTDAIIGAAIEVHRTLGPGLLESVYEECLALELASAGIRAERQRAVPVRYKARDLDLGFKLDLLVEDSVVVELKAVEKLLPVHEAQLLSYLRLGSWRVGLLINFNEVVLRHGIRRRVI